MVGADGDRARQLPWRPGLAVREGDAEAAQRLATALHPFWYIRGHLSEGRIWLERALAEGRPTPAAVRAGAVLAAGWLAWAQGDYARADEGLRDASTPFTRWATPAESPKRCISSACWQQIAASTRRPRRC